jgi:hypothetical protein
MNSARTVGTTPRCVLDGAIFREFDLTPASCTRSPFADVLRDKGSTAGRVSAQANSSL